MLVEEKGLLAAACFMLFAINVARSAGVFGVFGTALLLLGGVD
jgi:hypothetical protein